MNIVEARQIVDEIFNKSVVGDEESFILNEALKYLFEETKDSTYLAEIGSLYYGQKRFDLALKYYEKARDLGFLSINNSLGYIWYYGRTGQRDYQKAYECFKITSELEVGNDYRHGQVNLDTQMESKMKLADMYKNGYYVKKDYQKYCEIVRELYALVEEGNDGMRVEIYLRMARIFEEEDEIDEAIRLYVNAKFDLVYRLLDCAFFGDINQMSWTVNDIFRLLEFDYQDFDLYDLFYLFKEEHKVSFKYKKKKYFIEAIKEGDNIVIKFNDQWYRSVNDFFAKAIIGRKTLMSLYFEIERLEVIE